MNRKTRKLITRQMPTMLLLAFVAVSVAMLFAAGHGANALLTAMIGMAVTANQLIARQDGNRRSYPVATLKRIYEGTLTYVNAAGYLDNVTAGGANRYAGIAIRDVDNSAGLDGALQCEVWANGDFQLVGTNLAQAVVGDPIYGLDNYTISITGTGGSYIGRLVTYISSTVGVVATEGAGALSDPSDLVTTHASTATAAGLTTGLIPAMRSGIVAITSDDANKQISLPAAEVGDRIYLLIGATGCELISSVAAHKVNDVTVGATNEAALTALNLYDCHYVKANTWLVIGYTKLGAVQAALVPDAL